MKLLARLKRWFFGPELPTAETMRKTVPHPQGREWKGYASVREAGEIPAISVVVGPPEPTCGRCAHPLSAAPSCYTCDVGGKRMTICPACYIDLAYPPTLNYWERTDAN